MTNTPTKTIKDFDLTGLHKKMGQMLFIEPGESCFAEGNFMAQMWFVTLDKFNHFTYYLLKEWDVREKCNQ